MEENKEPQQLLQDRRDEEKTYTIRSNQLSGLVNQINKSIKLRIAELKNVLIFAIVVIGIVSYLFYDTMKYIREEVRSTSAQVDIVLSQNLTMQKNMKALSGTLCYNCHNTSVMFLPKTTLSLGEFTKYVRGDRFVTNSVMPIFSEKDISDLKLQEIWKNLY